MKRINKLISLLMALCLTLTVLAGCESETAPSQQTGSGGKPADASAVNQAGTNGEEAETEPDYSWFEMPEETGKLVVYTDGSMGSSVMSPAVQIFKEHYPEIEVDFKVMGDAEFETLIRTEIPAGRGPDLLIFTTTDIPDPYKTMRTGLFVDLNPYFASDEEIDLGDFLGPVMDEGVMNGKRYLVPLNYEVPILKMARSSLEEVGVTEEEIKTCDGFYEAAARFHELYPTATLYIDNFYGVGPENGDIQNVFSAFGLRLIDFEADRVSVEEELLKRCADLVKLYYKPDYNPDSQAIIEASDRLYSVGWALHNKYCLFDGVFTGLSTCMQTAWRLKAMDDELVLIAQTNRQNGVTAELVMNAAIPVGAANKASAWKLLKILLSDDIQAGHDERRYGLPYFWVGYPVRRASLEAFLAPEAEGGDEAFVKWFMEVVQSPTDAMMFPQIHRKYLKEEILPYVRGTRSWPDAYKRFFNTVELYKDE